VQLEVDDLRRISVHLAPIPQPPTRDDIVASQKSRFEDQDKTIVYMFLWMSLTWVVTVCAIWKFKMAASGGQNLHWNPMRNNIFIFFLRTAKRNLTKLGRDVSRIFKVTWWPCFLTNLHKSNNSCVEPHRKHLYQVWFWII
jgi:hypothetical protein